MGDPFRRLILDTVSVVIAKDANGDTLIELLRVATPDLDPAELCADAAKREKLFKTLKLRIHPDKHPGDMERATALYQDVQPFFDRCVTNIHKRPSKQQPKAAAPPRPMKRNNSNGGGSSRSTNAPASSGPQNRRGNSSNAPTLRIEFEFDTRKKWGYLDRAFDQPSFPVRGCSADGLSALVAYQCINARGAIAHGRKTERFYSQDQVLQKPASVDEKFSMRGGTKTLQGVDAAGIEAIKAEIVTRGPVVSTSFVLTEVFSKRPENRGAFLLSQIGKCHPVLLIGWRVTNLGDLWLAQPLKRGSSDSKKKTAICIPFGQFGIDKTILAPISSFENVPWQHGPYFDHDMGMAPEWRSWPSLRMHLSSSELERFVESVGGGTDGGLIALHEKKITFAVRHKEMLAHSRRCRLKEVRWEKNLEKWLVSCSFV